MTALAPETLRTLRKNKDLARQFVVMSLDEQNPLRLQVYRKSIGVEDAMIEKPDIDGMNGCIHVINKALSPVNTSAGDILRQDGNFSGQEELQVSGQEELQMSGQEELQVSGQEELQVSGQEELQMNDQEEPRVSCRDKLQVGYPFNLTLSLFQYLLDGDGESDGEEPSDAGTPETRELVHFLRTYGPSVQ
ncbi:unnamed protein product, partial [Timema podura]|nr:unnamed protein product [Timema podura]